VDLSVAVLGMPSDQGRRVEVGRGGLIGEQVERFLTEPSPAPAKLTAPASGLFLERVPVHG
jgi:hypothetical protein